MAAGETQYIPPYRVAAEEANDAARRYAIETQGLPKLWGHLALRDEAQLLLFPDPPAHGEGWVSQGDDVAVYTTGFTPDFETGGTPQLSVVAGLADVVELSRHRKVA